ncbi:MAG TPA: diaminopimelate decarboxylase [Acinetobacter lwoffii]|nr:diaminopimelate decarboxylase [Acinetobacter lwoffii]
MIGKVRSTVEKIIVNRSIDRLKESQLRNLSLWGLSVNDQNSISIGSTDISALLNIYGSPLFVVNKEQLIRDACSIQNAVKRVGRGSKVLYSYKTNCIPGILKEIHSTGIGAEVISPYELWLAEKMNIPGKEIVYNGVNKNEESLVRAIELDIFAINIDCLNEIERIATVARRLKRKVRVGIRLGFISKAQFGLEIESGEAMEACKRIASLSDCLEMTSIHFCVASNARNSATHKHFVVKSLNFMQAVKHQTGLRVSYLDIGGGIGVPTTKNMSGSEYGLYRLFGCLPAPPDPKDYEEIDSFIDNIDSTVKNTCVKLNMDPPGLIFEPGRFVSSRAEFLLSTVLDIKNKNCGTRFAITDAGRLSTTFPCDFEYHEIFTADQIPRKNNAVYNIMGRICTSADWMAKNRLMPELRENDVLVTMDAGAYFSSYSTNFGFPRPAVIMVTDTGSELLRSAETYEHLTGLDTIMNKC